MQEKYSLDTPVRYLNGVGPRRGEDLARLGINTVEEMLYYLPSRYEDRSTFTAIRDIEPGEGRSVEGEVISTSSRFSKRGMPMFQAALTDRTGIIHAVWFRQPYLKDYLRKGQRVVLYGKVEKYDKLQFVSPEYEILKEPEKDSVNMGRIVPVYPSSAGLTQKYLRGLAHQAISKWARLLSEKLPTYLLARQKLVDIRFAIGNIHFPGSFEHLDKAYRRIVFEEFFVLQLALAIRKRLRKEEAPAPGHVTGGGLAESFRRSLPYELTSAQKRAIADIERDISSTKPMNRLLEGDVGSGKTAVAASALVTTVQNGYQGVIMAPTEVLARQHFIGLSELLMPLGINVTLVVGGMDRNDRERIELEIAEGRSDIIVGTHAVIQDSVRFKKLGLAIIDEQHKFGVTQRSALKSKGHNPHILVMTATPIPRTLALTVYGDLDVSVIKEMPKGRKPITTYWVEEEKAAKAYDFVREELAKGRQAYVICPLIEEGDRVQPSLIREDRNSLRRTGAGSLSRAVPGKGAVQTFERLRDEVFRDFRVALMHGRMAPKEKDKAMRLFKKGEVDVLVSTVVIEVGIDVPNATVMLIENADRFGLSQLHQLRGRVGRGEHESYCLLLADPKTEEASKRLAAVEETLDGFEIAEADLDIRGPGEFFGTKQHGLPEIRFGNILKDFAIMEGARAEAFSLIAKDPALSEEHHRALRQTLAKRFGGSLDLMHVA
jgi:ATP-dependent DNA helicase RecG